MAINVTGQYAGYSNSIKNLNLAMLSVTPVLFLPQCDVSKCPQWESLQGIALHKNLLSQPSCAYLDIYCVCMSMCERGRERERKCVSPLCHPNHWSHTRTITHDLVSWTVLFVYLSVCVCLSYILLCELRSDGLTPAEFDTATTSCLSRLGAHVHLVCLYMHYNVIILLFLLYNYIHMLISTA